VLRDDKILVVELIDPAYNTESGQVRYQIKVFDDVFQVDLKVDSEPATAADVVGSIPSTRGEQAHFPRCSKSSNPRIPNGHAPAIPLSGWRQQYGAG
jgi:hypothetical protein